jgi:hypothetical protein
LGEHGGGCQGSDKDGESELLHCGRCLIERLKRGSGLCCGLIELVDATDIWLLRPYLYPVDAGLAVPQLTSRSSEPGSSVLIAMACVIREVFHREIYRIGRNVAFLSASG